MGDKEQSAKVSALGKQIENEIAFLEARLEGFIVEHNTAIAGILFRIEDLKEKAAAARAVDA